mgnify:CR=1 FL=1
MPEDIDDVMADLSARIADLTTQLEDLGKQVQLAQEHAPALVEQFNCACKSSSSLIGGLSQVCDRYAELWKHYCAREETLLLLTTLWTPSLEKFFDLLKRRGFAPARAVDCGAFEGDWASGFARFFPDAKVLMVEALREQEPVLSKLCDESDGRLDYTIAVLGEEDGKEVDFYECEACSSMFEWMPSSRSRLVHRKTQTLQSVLDNHPDFCDKPIDMIKFDLEGFELPVLKTIEGILPSVSVLQIEMHIVPINGSCASLGQLCSWLEDRDFRFCDLSATRYQQDGMLNFIDLVFVQENSPFFPEFSLPITALTERLSG